MYIKIIYLVMVYLFAQVTHAQINKSFKSTDPIEVLNFGTFHMGFTSDANSTEFDEHNSTNKAMVHEVAEAIAKFKPTVIIVEQLPQYDEGLNELYQSYLKNPDLKMENPNEINLLAFEVGRLAGAKQFYGIDYSEGYNYMINKSIPNYNDKDLFEDYMTAVITIFDNKEKKSRDVKQMLYNTNTKEFLDAMINLNADMLTHVSSEGKAEGADEAAKFYHRNLLMYSNLNQLPLTKDDRVFILMGATHTAFFNMWLERSPKYQLVHTLDYLEQFK
ncbi:DUF5694 domain-containing protein [Myroides guanonis]|uniref:TraB family protein n=1 Tax=Myroides guanonis TaxID=1150112 RepID=A0A1I3LIW4_9FLAO|nr:DUF5694 domain-containing protein [Myroides guanonis]SFI84672.1 hypothetical protein SAMN04487893_101354 [Myroides guanonis]